MAKMEKKALSAPDEKRSFDKGQLEPVTLGGVTFGRATLQWVEMVNLRKTNRQYRKLRATCNTISPPCSAIK
jgi:hypothetical protein